MEKYRIHKKKNQLSNVQKKDILMCYYKKNSEDTDTIMKFQKIKKKG